MSALMIHQDGDAPGRRSPIAPELQRLIDGPSALKVEVPDLAQRREDIGPMVAAWLTAELSSYAAYRAEQSFEDTGLMSPGGAQLKPLRLSERLIDQLRTRAYPAGLASLSRVVRQLYADLQDRDWNRHAEIVVDAVLEAMGLDGQLRRPASPDGQPDPAASWSGSTAWRQVLDRLDQVRVEQPPLVVLQGRRGAGKRALLESLAEQLPGKALTPVHELDRAARADASKILTCGVLGGCGNRHRVDRVAWPHAEQLSPARQRHLADLLGVSDMALAGGRGATSIITLDLTDEGRRPPLEPALARQVERALVIDVPAAVRAPRQHPVDRPRPAAPGAGQHHAVGFLQLHQELVVRQPAAAGPRCGRDVVLARVSAGDRNAALDHARRRGEDRAATGRATGPQADRGPTARSDHRRPVRPRSAGALYAGRERGNAGDRAVPCKGGPARSSRGPVDAARSNRGRR